jgi:hypothetical protein
MSEEAGSMNEALNEMIDRMTVEDLQRARLSSERARDEELMVILSERLAVIGRPFEMAAGGR